MYRASTGYEQVKWVFRRAASEGLGRAGNDPSQEGVQSSLQGGEGGGSSRGRSQAAEDAGRPLSGEGPKALSGGVYSSGFIVESS